MRTNVFLVKKYFPTSKIRKELNATFADFNFILIL